MAKKITLYVDDETEKLLEEDTLKSYSQIFKSALKEELKNIKSLNEEFDKLPSEDTIQDTFKHLPSVEEIEGLAQAFDKLPSEDTIQDTFKHLPSVEEIEELNEALDKTLKKMQKIELLK